MITPESYGNIGDKSALPKGGIMYVPHLVIKKDEVEKFHQELNKLMGK